MSKKLFIEYTNLDFKQKKICDLELDSSFIVQGCAGSGKTCLALARMKRILKDKNNSCHYIVFVRSLVENIRQELSDNEMDSDLAITARSFFDGQYPRSYGYKKEIINQNPTHLFVDECQDFSFEDLCKFKYTIQKGITFYGDDAQQIFDFTKNPIQNLKEIGEHFGMHIYSLPFNYRLPKKIAEFADAFSSWNAPSTKQKLSDSCKKENGEKPYIIQVGNIDEQVDFIKKRLNYFSSSSQKVGILCHGNPDVKNIYQNLKDNFEVTACYNMGNDYHHLNPNIDTQIMTFHQAKGQQFDVVIILSNNELSTIQDFNELYVGITRAESKLYILYENQPNWLDYIPENLYNETDEATDDDEELE